jgi:hypothetical protein
MDVKTNYDLYLKIGREYNIKVNNDKIENNILDILKNKFDNNLIKNDYEFSKHDYTSDRFLIELKTRNIKMNLYKTTMINKSKIINTHKTIIFVFNFIDYLTYYVYNKEDIINNICHYGKGYRKDRGFCEVFEMLYIPINKLTILQKNPI